MIRTALAVLAATPPAPASDVALQLPNRTVALPHSGTLRIAGVSVRSLRARLTPSAAVSAVVRGRRVTLAQGRASRLTYTATGARALRRPQLRGRVFGKLLVGPVPLARPSTATDLTTATITWHVRESFVQYMQAGEGAAASDGATALSAYDFGFTFRGGWRDAASGKTVARFRGTVRFSYKAHGIALRASDPEIELNGTRSRAIFRVGNGKAASRRAVLVDLHPAKATAAGEIPGTIPSDASASVFAGYYLPGDPFGFIVLS